MLFAAGVFLSTASMWSMAKAGFHRIWPYVLLAELCPLAMGLVLVLIYRRTNTLIVNRDVSALAACFTIGALVSAIWYTFMMR
jgi:hypothetical protein